MGPVWHKTMFYFVLLYLQGEQGQKGEKGDPGFPGKQVSISPQILHPKLPPSLTLHSV